MRHTASLASSALAAPLAGTTSDGEVVEEGEDDDVGLPDGDDGAGTGLQRDLPKARKPQRGAAADLTADDTLRAAPAPGRAMAPQTDPGTQAAQEATQAHMAHACEASRA